MEHAPADLFRLYFRGLAAADYASGRGLVGLDFDHFGRELGRRLVRRSARAGVSLLISPVSIVRYFEFDFAWRHLPPTADLACLDVSSPRLFALRVADSWPGATVRMLNPDAKDLASTLNIASILELANLTPQNSGVEVVRSFAGAFDVVWSLSVVEHIAGAVDDRQAVRWMWDAVKPGGRLILTVPTDRTAWDEYREADPYGTQPTDASGRVFFQRWYTPETLHQRLIGSVGQPPPAVEWFGERTPGRLVDYERRWAEGLLEVTCDDPREVVDHWQTYRDWSDMPGRGVVGLVFAKEPE